MSNIIMQDVTSGGYSAGDWLDVTKPVGVITSDITYTQTGQSYGVLMSRTGITELNLPNTTLIPVSFAQYADIEKITAPKLTLLGQRSLQACTRLRTVVFPLLNHLDQYSLRDCTALTALDIGGTSASNGGFRADSLTNSPNVGVIVLRANSVFVLTNTSVLRDTKFGSGKAGGTLYVPASLISSYQAATNWSTILGYENNQIKSIESTATDPDAPVDLTTHYIDGTLIPSA